MRIDGLYGYLPPPSEELLAYARSLYARRASAVMVPRKMIDIYGWRPEPKDCHTNAATCAAADPRVKAARGWLICDYPTLGYLRFTAHSVIEFADGEMADITPVPHFIRMYRFLKADLPEEQFHAVCDALLAAHGYAHLDHVLP